MQATKFYTEALNSYQLHLFSEEEMRDKCWTQFINSELGQLYLTIPFEDLASCYPKREHSFGPRPWFTVKGGIGLMFLKKYYNGLSDKKLIHLVNNNWMLQIFCGMRLKKGERIKDETIISSWRTFLGKHLKVDELQMVLKKEWKEDIEQKQTNISDATCYESYVRYPTDVKLLWESVEWLHSQIVSLCIYLKSPRPRNKFKDIKKAYLSFSKMKKRRYKKRRGMQRRLLNLLDKLMGQITPLIGFWKTSNRSGFAVNLRGKQLVKPAVKPNFFERLSLIKKVYNQQKLHFERPDLSIPNRIVSLDKAYLRPIVRGKETKRVEFGKKVHKMMVGGIGFIEHWDYNAFHEGVRAIKTIHKHRKYFGKCSHFGGDAIYATNKNRSYCSKHHIFTSFKRKGRAAKHEDQNHLMRSLIAKERATVLEGSFGNEKNHYALKKIKARTEHTENAWIFFGMMCANAMKIVKIRAKRTKAPPDKKRA